MKTNLFEIVEGVKRGGGSPLRPAIDESAVEEEVATLMRRCWAQDAADRPDFPALKQTIRKINKELDPSVIADGKSSDGRTEEEIKAARKGKTRQRATIGPELSSFDEDLMFFQNRLALFNVAYEEFEHFQIELCTLM
ncbi:Atrial natriuretic peptide receptor 2 [Melipona quadrifasciata]|uniref:Atrial natriuretic peptide receptor 2 n=1 Tax=Melipona quadrifasciata TaxID=166423 RepID=A0A0M9A931_9HYME|nr:Atrial natriuretic peptide receptor 2 [Melipona quadrifasciata]